MDQQVVIWSGEHQAYWRAHCSGYVSDIRDAGIYSRSFAEKRTSGCGPEKRIEIRPARLVQISVPYLIDRVTPPNHP